eukprot:TRINITY_DN139_c0_g1_i1.p2 TRINITY_DN139_c0_g1~~TRINITY_DN139_c0_g1_i1.p2  ORF type:complete len:210 (+),score=61.37 TRINITY_DN139_c0_g1_i1:45-632(+)
MFKTLAMLFMGLVAAECYINPRPPFTHKADFARWLVHESNWTILATSSIAYDSVAYPNLLAVSDGTSWTDCSGKLYLYFTELSTIWRDIQKRNNVTLGFYEVGEKDVYCTPGATYDPEDPNCAKVHFVGSLDIISNVTAGPIPEKYLFWRHPAMANWPKDHNWMTATLDIQKIDILDFYGNIQPLALSDYWAATC